MGIIKISYCNFSIVKVQIKYHISVHFHFMNFSTKQSNDQCMVIKKIILLIIIIIIIVHHKCQTDSNINFTQDKHYLQVHVGSSVEESS